MVELGQVYVDASVIVGLTLAQAGALYGVKWASATSSELIAADVLRTLDRLRLTAGTPERGLAGLREIAERSLAGLSLVPIDKVVLRRAGGPFPTPIETLDAIHLATALLWADYAGDIVFLTHDRQLGIAVYPNPL